MHLLSPPVSVLKKLLYEMPLWKKIHGFSLHAQIGRAICHNIITETITEV